MEEELVATRRQKAERLQREFHISPFLGQEFVPGIRLGEVHHLYGNLTREELEGKEITLKVAGRIVARRDFGKAGFLKLQDQTGSLQIYCRRDRLSPEQFALYELLDLGDFLGVSGNLFRTRTGELTVEARELFFLTKALRDLPEKWHGLTDVELRYRRRYLDLLANPESRQRFFLRSRIVDHLRNFLKSRGYLEVETPILHLYSTGARARPFTTHHNALDLPLVLRIAPELYLKRLVVGGFERVFELGRAFRNEGISTQHNPEFTILEWYEAYTTVEGMMSLLEEMLVSLVEALFQKREISYQGEVAELGAGFLRLSMVEAVRKHLGMRESLEHPYPLFCFSLSLDGEFVRSLLDDFCRSLDFPLLAEFLRNLLGETISSPQEALPRIQRLKGYLEESSRRDQFLEALKALPYPDPRIPAGVILNALFEEFVEERLRAPTFVYDFPVFVSPLAARKPPPEDHLCQRFELFLFGKEIANGFRELNDPFDQRQRFLQQEALRAYGDLEAMQLDEDYLRALEHGLPPTVGAGLGVDRLVMILTDSASIRDVILFPLLKPRS